MNLQCRKIFIFCLFSHLLDEHREIINGKTFKKYVEDTSFTYKKNVPFNPFNKESFNKEQRVLSITEYQLAVLRVKEHGIQSPS